MGMFKKLLKGNSQSARMVRGAAKTGSLPILSPAGTLRLNEVFWQAVPPATIFVFVFVCLIQSDRFRNDYLWHVIAFIGAFAMMVVPTIALFVYVAGIYKTVRHSVARTSALIFWLYWPFWRFTACVVALILAHCVGNHLWFNNFQLYIEYGRLQAYDNVDAFSVTGDRMQDAGLVVFNSTNGVDRGRAGCIVNGHTYCIAPVLQGGAVKPGEKQSKTDTNDVFVAGIDCCNCPVTDFRCGDWADPSGKLGGMRIFDEEHRKMFRLAVDRWDADYKKASVHPIFFNWQNDPVAAWKQLYTRGVQLATLACIFAVFGSFLIMVILNGLMRFLMNVGIAAPLDEYYQEAITGNWGMGQEACQAPERQSFVPDQYRSYMTQWEPTADEDNNYVVL